MNINKVAGVLVSPINTCRMCIHVSHHMHLVNIHDYYLPIKKNILRGRRITSVVRALATLTEDLSLGLSTDMVVCSHL